MKKIRIILIALIIVLCAGMTAFAAEYTDVPKGVWYYDYVSELSEKGIIKGYGGGIFLPYNDVTCAEALKLILQATGHEIQQVSTPEQLFEFWGSDVIATAENYGIIARGEVDGSMPATRSQVANFIVKAMGLENTSHSDEIFVDTTLDSAEVLYQKGIITGVDTGVGYSFNPNTNLTRAEASAIIYRIYGYNPLELLPVTRPAEGFLFKDPVKVSDFEKVLVYMAINNLTELSITYTDSISQYSQDMREQMCQNVLDASNVVFPKYHEYFCYFDSTRVTSTADATSLKITIYLENSELTGAQIREMRATFFAETERELLKMIGEGAIRADMTDEEKAKAVYERICKICEYDHDFEISSFFGYGAIVNGEAVCQGYTALFNAMAKRLGIWSYGLAGEGESSGKWEGHIWNVANIGGKQKFIDVTFGDTSEKEPKLCNYDYFCKDPADFQKTHRWQ